MGAGFYLELAHLEAAGRGPEAHDVARGVVREPRRALAHEAGEDALVLPRVGLPVAGGFDAVVYSEGGCVVRLALWPKHLRGGVCASAEKEFDGFATSVCGGKSYVEGAPPRIGDCVNVGSSFDEKVET